MEFLRDYFSLRAFGPGICVSTITGLRTFQLIRIVIGTPHGATVSFAWPCSFSWDFLTRFGGSGKQKTRCDLNDHTAPVVLCPKNLTARAASETPACPELQRARPDAAADSPAEGHGCAIAQTHANGRCRCGRWHCHSPTRAAAAAPDYR